MTNKRILYALPSIGETEVELVVDAVRNGWGTDCYTYLTRFEEEFARAIGTRHAIATSSATGALTLTLAALGVGPGDEVVLADINWIATLSPIVHLGATPVLVDVRSDTWCIDPNDVLKVVSPRTKVVIATHLYGNPADVSALKTILRDRACYLIEDAAEAIGTSIDGQAAGGLTSAGVFSFHGTKTITTGEGGAVVTNDDDLADRIRILAEHGRAPGESRQFWPATIGYKFKMSNIQAALGCGQLARVDDFVRRKRSILQRYMDNLGSINGLTMNMAPSGTELGAWMSTVVLPRESAVSRDELIQILQAAGVDARVFFWPLSMLGLLPEPRIGKTAWDISARGLNLPSYVGMSDDDVDVVSQLISDALSGG